MSKFLIFSMLFIATVVVGGIFGGPIAAIIVAALCVSYGGLFWIYYLMKKHLH